MKYTCSMETVQQNGCFTLFSSKFHSNIYSILFGPIVSPPIPSISYSNLSVLSYLHLLCPYRTQPSPSYRILAYSVHIILNPLRPIVSPPTPYIAYSTLSVLSYLHLLRTYRTQPSPSYCTTFVSQSSALCHLI